MAKLSASARTEGWPSLFDDPSWTRVRQRFPIAAYSEFMPPPRIGQKPYGTWARSPLIESDPWGWRITPHETDRHLRPGLKIIGSQLLNDLVAVAEGNHQHNIGEMHLADNPYWPKSLRERAASLTHERFLVLSPLALSLTQDDKGHVRWTLFGGSEQGPSRGFWKSFYSAPGVEVDSEQAQALLAVILVRAYGEPGSITGDLKSAGVRILPDMADDAFPNWHHGQLPSWAQAMLLGESESLDGVRYLLTFRPFAQLPLRIQEAYLEGRLALLPYPGSLVLWGSPHYRALHSGLRGAIQIPLLLRIARHEGRNGIRVPQSGWMHEPVPGHEQHAPELGPLRNTFRRSHRWEKLERDDDTLSVAREDAVHKVLFSAHPDDIGLYGKPMARNAQVWSESFEPVLDGPTADGADLHRALECMKRGGSFGYRLYYPPMLVGTHEVFWHRPLVAFRDLAGTHHVMTDGVPNGYLVATDHASPAREALELWPRTDALEAANAPVAAEGAPQAAALEEAELNLRKLEDARVMLGVPVRESFARALLTTGRVHSFAKWQSVSAKIVKDRPALARRLTSLASDLDSTAEFLPPRSWTFGATARRSFETAYWKTIAMLSEGRYLTKNNGDIISDPVTAKHVAHATRDLDPLGDYLAGYYNALFERAGLAGKALAGYHRFKWQTDFNFDWMGSWSANDEGTMLERNILAVIPGRNRREAVILADHYDTAYMEDIYGYGPYKGDGARVAAAGADDNHSATATLMLAAPIFLEMSQAGQLGCDVWLVHLTGEEFPSDCLGARNLCQALVEGRLALQTDARRTTDLSKARIRGVYVMDMIAHNNPRGRDIFQIAPGSNPQSWWLAYQAHEASELWTAGCRSWNQRAQRAKARRARRSADPRKVPATARHLASHGEVRPHYDPRSTLFNTDGQIFSDAGVPVVLFMENYDINRKGYHDTHDTMENIDLDYGAALAAIAIESAARAANTTPPDWRGWPKPMTSPQ